MRDLKEKKWRASIIARVMPHTALRVLATKFESPGGALWLELPLET